MVLDCISILSCEEYEKYHEAIPKLSQWWWLKTPGYVPKCVRRVKNLGDQRLNGPYCDSVCGVRPSAVLVLEPSDKEFWMKHKMLPGTKIHYGLWNWTVLDVMRDALFVFCDHVVARYPFDLTTNQWNNSCLKEWLETHGNDTICSYDIESIGNIESISLLTKKEYHRYRRYIPDLSVTWWLRSSDDAYIHYVYTDYDRNTLINRDGENVQHSVRPAIKIKLNESIKSLPGFYGSIVGLVFNYGKYTWTVLDYDYDANTLLALCDSTIAKRSFDSKSRMWENSELKSWLEFEGIRKITKKGGVK